MTSSWELHILLLMRVIAKRTLREFYESHPDARGPLLAWHDTLVKADWKSWTDMKARFRSADSVGNDRYIFNIKGNKYRLVAKIDFPHGLVFIRFIGTHGKYDSIEPKEA